MAECITIVIETLQAAFGKDGTRPHQVLSDEPGIDRCIVFLIKIHPTLVDAIDEIFAFLACQ
jgi:hypothetical protein